MQRLLLAMLERNTQLMEVNSRHTLQKNIVIWLDSCVTYYVSDQETLFWNIGFNSPKLKSS